MSILSAKELARCKDHIEVIHDELKELDREKSHISKKIANIDKIIGFMEKYLPFFIIVIPFWFLYCKKNKLEKSLDMLVEFQQKVQEKVFSYKKAVDFFDTDQINIDKMREIRPLLLAHEHEHPAISKGLLHLYASKGCAIQRLQFSINFINRDMRCFIIDLNAFCSI